MYLCVNFCRSDCGQMLLTRDVVKIQKTKVNSILVQEKRKVNWRNVKVAVAIHPLTILCGSFKIFDRAFLRKYFDLLKARVFDAIMLS